MARTGPLTRGVRYVCVRGADMSGDERLKAIRTPMRDSEQL